MNKLLSIRLLVSWRLWITLERRFTLPTASLILHIFFRTASINCNWRQEMTSCLIIFIRTDDICTLNIIINFIQIKRRRKLDLAFNNVKPKDRYFVIDYVQFRTELRCVRLTNQNFWLNGSRASFLVPSYSPSKS